MNASPADRGGERSRRRIPLWLKIVYTLFVCLLIPVYSIEHGVLNFMWFSNIALLATVGALWLEHRLLAGVGGAVDCGLGCAAADVCALGP